MNKVRDRINFFITLAFLVPSGILILSVITLGQVPGYLALFYLVCASFFMYKAHHVTCPKCGGRIRLLIPYKYRCSRCEKYY